MQQNLTRRLAEIDRSTPGLLSESIRRGLEKESLRIDHNGVLAQTPHPQALGAALTHPHITTDYSEALLEFVTPVTKNIPDLIQFLTDLHGFTYRNIGEEKLWVNSMPCILHGEESIPIADYGQSNAGRMKVIYREGLGHRYGKLMQTIAGIHFNFSLDEAFWQCYRQIKGSTIPLRDFKSQEYLGLMRNFYRSDWAIPYLFGASPAVCGTFLEGRQHHLQPLGDHSYCLPFATSLRLTDLGYRSEAQDSVHLSLNSLDEYTESLIKATTESYLPYQKIGIKVDGEYRQLNDSLLQIENEYYASMRPKRIAKSGERPSHALRSRGVEYIELRSLDLDPFLPVGISEDGIRFLDLMMISCLLEASPMMDVEEFNRLRQTRNQVAERGRDPELRITLADGSQCSIDRCGLGLVERLAPIAELMDQYDSGYGNALAYYKNLFEDPSATPSARAFEEIKKHDNTFFYFAKAQAEQHEKNFKIAEIDPAWNQSLKESADESIKKAQEMVTSDMVGFEEFLDNYFAHKSAS